MNARLGDPVGLNYRTAVGNALYEHAGWSPDQINYYLDEVERAYAHELAEKIRRHWYPKFPGKSEYTQGVDDGFEKAADLIDPESS